MKIAFVVVGEGDVFLEATFDETEANALANKLNGKVVKSRCEVTETGNILLDIEIKDGKVFH